MCLILLLHSLWMSTSLFLFCLFIAVWDVPIALSNCLIPFTTASNLLMRPWRAVCISTLRIFILTASLWSFLRCSFVQHINYSYFKFVSDNSSIRIVSEYDFDICIFVSLILKTLLPFLRSHTLKSGLKTQETGLCCRIPDNLCET